MDHLTTAQLIARGRTLNEQISAANAELKLIESELRTRALAMPHEPLAQAEREGRKALLRDDDQELTVLFESDVLKASFAADSPVAQAVLPLLSPTETKDLFRKKTTYERIQKDGHKFRLLANQLLQPDVATMLIHNLKDRDKNGIVKSKTVIAW
ncbi:MAG: hypothetical protein ACNA8L_10450 [Luteolibacter sp.]